MKKIHILTVVSVFLSVLSLCLTFYQYQYRPAWFDFRIAAGVLGTAAIFASFSELMKYTSRFQFAGVLLGGIATGLSIDNFMHSVPFITLSIFLGNLVFLFRLIFKKYFSEVNHTWIEPVLLVSSIACYLAGNINHDSPWMLGWILPAIGIIINIKELMSNMKFSKIQSAFVKKKMGIESGKPAPLFSLPDQDGNIVNLSDYTGKRHVLLVFVRGDWCPSCHMMLRTYQKNSTKFQKKNVVLFAIGPDPVGVNREMASKLGIEFKVLSDEGQKTAMAYSVQLPTGVVGEKYSPGIPLPASFLIESNGMVRYASSPEKIGEFLDPATIFPVLESLN